MDFGDILDDWDKKTAKPVGKKRIKEAEREASVSAAAIALAEEAETKTVKPSAVKKEPPRVDPLTAWLRTNPIPNKDADPRVNGSSISGADHAERRRRLHAKAPDASIDLHGLTRDEAWARLSAFFADAKGRRLEKIRIVHGKGNHSEGEAVLKKTTREFIERCPFAGESGSSDNRSGGSGATWVILKEYS
ncbi:MAG: Smr/MutS family protein [Treponemataceae bacterium]